MKEVPVEVVRHVEIPVEKIVEKYIPQDSTKIEELSIEVSRLLEKLEEKERELAFKTSPDAVEKAISAMPDDVIGNVGTTSFGTTWPSNPARGDLFLKVDTKPNKLYKWNNKKWIEIDRSRVDDTLAYDHEYIDYVIQELRKGHRDYDDLSDIERAQIIARIKDQNNS